MLLMPALRGLDFMSVRRSPFFVALLLAVAWASRASAQTADPPSLRAAVTDLTAFFITVVENGQPRQVDFSVASAIETATALEVANAPFGSSAGGFVFKLDPATGLKVRSAPTFGPSFAERALTAGEGKVSFGASLSVATYDKLNEASLERMPLVVTDSPTPDFKVTALTSMVLSSETLVVSTAIGATDNLDIAVAVPFVKVKLNGVTSLETPDHLTDDPIRRNVSSAGLGDLAISAKYRFLKFGEGPPDPGGVAFLLTTRLPTGNRENFRGLGITRVLGSAIVSAGKGKIRPHLNAGFEWWEKGLQIKNAVDVVTLRHQVQYAAGVELDAGPKVTLLVDFLGRHVLGGGAVVLRPSSLRSPVFTSVDVAEATATRIRKLTLAPGLKWNLKGSFVLSANSLISVVDNGLRDFFTPVVGVDWTF